MTKAVNELSVEWSLLRSRLAAGWTSVFSRGAIKPPANVRPPSSPKFIRAHDMVACLPLVWQLSFFFRWTLYADERPSCVGSEQSALTEGDACAGQDEPWSRHVVKEQRLLRGMDAPPARGSEN